MKRVEPRQKLVVGFAAQSEHAAIDKRVFGSTASSFPHKSGSWCRPWFTRRGQSKHELPA
jgi:hypothetical protein